MFVFILFLEVCSWARLTCSDFFQFQEVLGNIMFSICISDENVFSVVFQKARIQESLVLSWLGQTMVNIGAKSILTEFTVGYQCLNRS